VYCPEAVAAELVMPSSTPRPAGEGVWVEQTLAKLEKAFDQEIEHPERVVRTHLVRTSSAGVERPLVLQEQHSGEVIHLTPGTPHYDLFFPPRVWMNDAASERCMMWNSAGQSQGRVLVAGLGLAIFPQMIMLRDRPVESITIVERDEEVIRLVGEAWAAGHRIPVHMVRGTIEEFLEDSGDETFDTIFLDTWGDAHHRFLAYVHYLIDLSARKLAEEGRILAWCYWAMRRGFVDLAVFCEEHPELLDRVDERSSTAMQRYTEWRRSLPTAPPDEATIVAQAEEIADGLNSSATEPLYIDRPRFHRTFDPML